MSDDQNRLERAGHYVLGLMDAPAQQEAERDMNSDPAFRDAVTRFSAHMQSLDATATPSVPPQDMWERIAARVSAMPQDALDSSGADQTRQQAEIIPLAARSAALRGRRTLSALQATLMAACLVAAAGLGYIAGRATSPMAQPVVMVVLQTPEQTPGAVFEAFADNSVRIVPLEDFVVPEGKIMQVWTLYDKAVGPVSLGTLPMAEVSVLKGMGMPEPVADQLYEITLEDAPGSPTGKPTGPILVKGFAKAPPGT